jgi:hypothetical protein
VGDRLVLQNGVSQHFGAQVGHTSYVGSVLYIPPGVSGGTAQLVSGGLAVGGLGLARALLWGVSEGLRCRCGTEVRLGALGVTCI